LTSHRFGLVEVLQLVTSLGQLPDKVIIFAVEAATCEINAEPSAQLVAAIPRLVTAIRQDIKRKR
jgi:hypothetical protein